MSYGAQKTQSIEEQGRSKIRIAVTVSKGCMLTVEEAEALSIPESDRLIGPALAKTLVADWSDNVST